MWVVSSSPPEIKWIKRNIGLLLLLSGAHPASEWSENQRTQHEIRKKGDRTMRTQFSDRNSERLESSDKSKEYILRHINCQNWQEKSHFLRGDCPDEWNIGPFIKEQIKNLSTIFWKFKNSHSISRRLSYVITCVYKSSFFLRFSPHRYACARLHFAWQTSHQHSRQTTVRNPLRTQMSLQNWSRAIGHLSGKLQIQKHSAWTGNLHRVQSKVVKQRPVKN